MFVLRRSALRIVSTSSPSVACKPRTIASLSQSLLRSKSVSNSLYQRRWASDEAPVSKLQPTPQEEVENAIHEDVVKAEESTVEEAISEPSTPEESAAVDAEVQDTPIPQAPPAPEQETAFATEQHTPSPSAQQPPAESQTSGRVYESSEDRLKRIGQPKPTIYIGNLFFDVTEDDLRKELDRFGAVQKIRLLRDSRGLSKGFGYVDFESTEAATAAINALHQQVFEGRRLVVQYAAFTTDEIAARRSSSGSQNNQPHQPRNPPSRTLFIGNMSYEMTDRDLNNLFRGVRNVVDVRVAIDRRTGQPRGFAHADFIDVKSAMEAMKQLSEKQSYGRRLRLDYSFASNSAPKNQQSPPPPRVD